MFLLFMNFLYIAVIVYVFVYFVALFRLMPDKFSHQRGGGRLFYSLKGGAGNFSHQRGGGDHFTH